MHDRRAFLLTAGSAAMTFEIKEILERFSCLLNHSKQAPLEGVRA
jgi:hypothetical protein